MTEMPHHNKSYKLISCEKLSRYVERLSLTDEKQTNFPLLLDCRPFFVFNECHIVGSVNVHCPTILRRRYGSRLPLRVIISNSTLRDNLINGGRVILYEEQELVEGQESMATIITKCLQQEAGLARVYVLAGGFQEFKIRYPELCTDSASIGNITIPGKTISPLCRTPPIRGRLAVEEEPVEILPHLYLGSAQQASCKATLLQLGITGLVNVSQKCPNHFEDTFTYLSIPVEDSTNEDIAVWFNQAICFIEKIRAESGKVLVHCHAGISRSATICMAYLMSTKYLRMEEAYEFVKSRRRIVSPNFNFMGQLLSFESQIASRKTRSPKSPHIQSSHFQFLHRPQLVSGV